MATTDDDNDDDDDAQMCWLGSSGSNGVYLYKTHFAFILYTTQHTQL